MARKKTRATDAASFGFKLGKDRKQILAVRYSCNPSNLYRKIGIVPDCLRMSMFPANENISYYASLVKKILFIHWYRTYFRFCSSLNYLIFLLFISIQKGILVLWSLLCLLVPWVMQCSAI
jgi:hypothetical protein